jgi:hypothetical protein
MQIQSNGKVRRTASEWEAIFEEFEESGLSVAAFCRRKKLAKSTFSKQHRGRARKPVVRRSSSARFVELTPAAVEVSPVAPIPEQRHSFELELPGGVVLRWKA